MSSLFLQRFRSFLWLFVSMRDDRKFRKFYRNCQNEFSMISAFFCSIFYRNLICTWIRNRRTIGKIRQWWFLPNDSEIKKRFSSNFQIDKLGLWKFKFGFIVGKNLFSDRNFCWLLSIESRLSEMNIRNHKN